MNIGLVGYGKMGKEIEKVAEERGHKISAIVNSQNPITQADFSNTDIVIEFSTPSVVKENINFLLDQNIRCVIGTTGWNDSLTEVTEKVIKNNGALVHASNFSIGVNLFFQLNEQLARIMNSHKDYYVNMEEVHHTQKLDAPSGTAITLAEGIIKNVEAVDNWNCPQSESNKEFNGGLEITAIREEDVKGIHKICYSSPIDKISIEHEAFSRKGFALGSVVAAEWLVNKKGIFTMRDVLNIK
jgi:4-hydroxy-tetrahydrodipicolinate reductase